MKGRLLQLSPDFVLRLERSYPALTYPTLSYPAVGNSSSSSNSCSNSNSSSGSTIHDDNALILSVLPDDALIPISLYGNTSTWVSTEKQGLGSELGVGVGVGLGVEMLSKEEMEQCYMIITPLADHTLWTGR